MTVQIHGIGDHATSALELPAVLGLIAGRARSQPGRERILDLAPHARLDHALAAQEIYADLMACADQGDAPPTVAPPDLRPELERLSREGAADTGDGDDCPVHVNAQCLAFSQQGIVNHWCPGAVRTDDDRRVRV